MGIITEISSQKNKKRVNVFLDGEFISGLSFESAVRHGLKIGKEINRQDLDKIIEESEISSAFSSGLDIIAVSNKTVKEIKQKLISKGYLEHVADQAITKMKEYNYIDDLSFAKSYVRSFVGKSRKELENKLKIKGIDSEIISSVLSSISEETEDENALCYARKYMRRKEFNEKNKNNLFAGLARKGFSLDTIYKVIDEIKKENHE